MIRWLTLRHSLYRLFLNDSFRRFSAGLLIVSIIYLLLFTTNLDATARHTLVFFLFVVYLWVSETFPLPVTAFLAGVGLVILGLRTRDEAFNPYAADAVFMILGSLIIAQGITASGAEAVLVRRFLRPFTGSTYRLLAGIIMVCAVLAAFIPDHSVAAIMLPIVLRIIDRTDIRHHPREMVAFTLAVAFACAIAGLATPSGGARNVIAMGFLRQLYGQQVSYVAWVVLAAPVSLMLMPLVFATLVVTNGLRNRRLDFEFEPARPFTGQQAMALLILVAVILLFVTSGVTGLTLGVIAMLGAILMYVTGILDWDESRQQLRWGVIFIYGAALSLGAAMNDVGVAEWLAHGLFSLTPAWGVMLMIVLAAALLTNVMSAGATAAVLVPITLAIGQQADLNLASVAIITAAGTAFAFMTSFGTPPNLIVHASGIPTARDFARCGIPMVIMAILVLLLVQEFYWPVAQGWLGW